MMQPAADVRQVGAQPLAAVKEVDFCPFSRAVSEAGAGWLPYEDPPPCNSGIIGL